jgi:hypothetical protein
MWQKETDNSYENTDSVFRELPSETLARIYQTIRLLIPEVFTSMNLLSDFACTVNCVSKFRVISESGSL